MSAALFALPLVGCASLGGADLQAVSGSAAETASSLAARAALDDLVDVVLSELGAMEALLADLGVDAADRAAVHGIQAEIGALALSLGINEDPTRSLLDLVANLSVLKGRSPLRSPPSPDVRKGVAATFQRLDSVAWIAGTEAFGIQEATSWRAAVDAWVATPTSNGVRLVRIQDVPSLAPEGAKILGSIRRVGDELSEARALGERLALLSEKLPLIARWQFEASAWGLVATHEYDEALASVSTVSSALEQLNRRIGGLPELLESEREEVLNAFDARLPELMGASQEVRTTAEYTEAMLVQGAQTVAALRALVAEVRELIDSSPVGSTDQPDLRAALVDIRQTAVSLDSLAARLAGTGPPDALIDRVFSRIVLVMLLGFVMLLVLILVWARHKRAVVG